MLSVRPAWVRIGKAPSPDEASLMPAKLHAGEIEVILLARQISADVVILDDNAARKTAMFLGLPVTGTLGVLLAAKRAGHIDAVAPYIQELRAAGFRLADSVAERTLSMAGEL